MILFQIVNCLNGCIVRNNDTNINKRREKNNYFKNDIGQVFHCNCYFDYLITHNYYNYTYYTILVTILHYL